MGLWGSGYIEIAVFMIILTSGCKYHSYRSIVNMKLEEYQRAELQFASKIKSIMAYCPITFRVMDTMLPLELLQILACPICKGELIQIEDGSSLQCKPCNRTYPVVEGIPILLPEQAGTNPRTRFGAS